MSNTIYRYDVSPRNKKSFIEINYLEKEINNKKVIIKQELVWRIGKVIVIIEKDKVQDFHSTKDLFESINKDNSLIFNDNFPFEWEFISSWDCCATDYSINHVDGTNVEESLEEELMNIIDEEGIYELEDNHDFIMTDTVYEIYGELDIYHILD